MEDLQHQIQQAKSLERAQKNDAALEVFLRLAAADGPHLDDPGFWLHAGDLGRRAGKPEVAGDAYPRAIELLERNGHPNSALAVARRWTRAAPESAAAHLRLGTLAVDLGYARDAGAGLVQALDLSLDDDVVEPAVDGLRTAWSLLRRRGFNDEADSVRARLLEIRPSADPLDDPALATAAAPDHLDVIDPSLDAAEPAPEPGLEPTQLAGVPEPEIDRLEGLEPTSAGGDWSAGPDDEGDPAGEIPNHPDLPLLRTAPEPEVADRTPAEPLDGLMPTSEEAPDVGRTDPDDSDEDYESADVGELPLLSALPEDGDLDGGDAGGVGQADTGEAARWDPDASDVDAADPDAADVDAADVDASRVDADEVDAGVHAGDHVPGDDEITGDAIDDPSAPATGAAAGRGAPTPAPSQPSADPGDDYIDLGALILSDDDEDGTRFQMDAAEHPSGDEDRDFAEILGKFRQQVSEKIDPRDSSSHYDLGLAFKDMGLLDDAIGQLQVALRGGSNPVATLEVLGECFIEKGEHSLAARVLDRATRIDAVTDSDLIGVLYWLGRTSQVLGKPEDARAYYERVVSVDISFRDAGARLDSLRDAPSPGTDT